MDPRGAAPGFASDMLRISARTSRGTDDRRIHRRLFQLQNERKARRCPAMTVRSYERLYDRCGWALRRAAARLAPVERPTPRASVRRPRRSLKADAHMLNKTIVAALLVTLTHTRTLALAVALTSPLLFSVAPPISVAAAGQHEAHGSEAGSRFLQTVREATAQFRDVGNTTAAGYGPALGCVSGPEEGAMGVHYVNPGLLLDGELDATRPEALIYEFKGNVARLVGAEFIVVAAQWHQSTGRRIRPSSRGSCCTSSTARIASVSRPTTSSMCGHGGITRRASSSTGTHASRAKDSEHAAHPSMSAAVIE